MTALRRARRSASRQINGRYHLNNKPLIVFWEHGINDFAQGVPTATTQANLAAWLKYWNTFYPGTYCVVLSPFPNGSTSAEAGLINLRPLIQAVVTESANIKNIFISETGTMFNPVTQSGTYAPDGTHLNDAGNALAATTIQTALNGYF